MGKQTKKTILVVDDEQDTRIFLSNLLRSEGLRPVIAENKIEGLQKVVKRNSGRDYSGYDDTRRWWCSNV